MLPGITNQNELVKALNSVGLDKFKVRVNRVGFSEADRKDSWMDMKRKGWSIDHAWDSSLDGFNEIYIFTKVKK